MAQSQVACGLRGEALEVFADLIMHEIYRRHPKMAGNDDYDQERAQIRLALGYYVTLAKPSRKKTRLGAVKEILGPWLGVEDFDECVMAANKRLYKTLSAPDPTSKRQMKRLQPKGGDQSRVPQSRTAVRETPEMKLLSDLFGPESVEGDEAE